MKFRSLFLSAVCLFSLSCLMSCSDNDDPEDEITSGILILNEGSYQGNNASITAYNPKTGGITADLYYALNDKKLGDAGQDMIAYGNRVYITVYGSSRLVKLDSLGKELKAITFSPAEGQPRYMAAEDGKLYVTLWSGQVARIDTTDLTIEKYVTVGANPEQIVEENNKLYVANSGYGAGTTVSVINLGTFTVEKTITVALNPNLIVEAADDIYVLSYGNFGDVPYALQRLNVANGTYDPIAVATKMTAHKDMIYLVNSVTDWSVKPSVTTNQFFTYNAKTRKLNENSFLTLTGEAESLKKESIMMMEIDPNTGDIYIGTSDYTNTGDVYRFSRNGKLIKKFGSGGISPNNAVFFE